MKSDVERIATGLGRLLHWPCSMRDCKIPTCRVNMRNARIDAMGLDPDDMRRRKSGVRTEQ